MYILYGNAATRTFGRAHRRRPYSFVWADCVWAIGFVWADCAWTVGDVWADCTWVVLFVGKTVHMNQHHRCCTFVSPGLPPIVGSPGESRGGEPMPSALYFLKSICVRETIHSPRVVMMYDEKKYNPQWGSLLACIVTQGRLHCTCQPCAIESITPMGYGHTAWFGAIECAM